MKNIFGGIAAFSLLIILVCLIRNSPWGQANLPTGSMASGYVGGVGEVLAKTGAAVVEKKTDNVGFMGRIETDDVLPTPAPSQNEGFEHVMGKMERPKREPSEGLTYVMGSREEPIIQDPPNDEFTHQMGRRETQRQEHPEQQMVYAPRRREAPERPSFEQGYAARPKPERPGQAHQMGKWKTNRGNWVWPGSICICGPATPRGVECAIVPTYR